MTEEKIKPDCKLLGTDGNVMSLTAKVSRCMKQNDMGNDVDDMVSRVLNSRYPECFKIFREYVNIV